MIKSVLLSVILIALTVTGFTPDKNALSENKTGVSSGSEKTLNSVKRISEKIKEKKASDKFIPLNLFSFTGRSAGNDNSSSFVSDAALMKLNLNYLKQIINRNTENVLFSIPVSEANFVELELTRSYPLSSDFKLFSINNNGKVKVNYNEGIHFSGIIKGNEKSIASVSIFENFMMAVISDENGNYVLGSVKDKDNSYTENYIFYNDSDLKILNKFKCGVDDNDEKFIRPVKPSEKNSGEKFPADNVSTLPVRVYFEADYQTYLDNQSNAQNVANFVSGMFNSVLTIYQNESIPTEAYSLGVWTIPDPYRNLTDSYDILQAFGELSQNDFQGNLAHLISTRNEGLGGIAWIRTLCADYDPQDFSGRYAFSNIDPSYNNYPLYSWTVNVVTHEMGHSIGSRHTHACVWPTGPGGSIRSIDSCYTAEGNCFTTLKPRVGTIMSYCHLWFGNGGGVNLALGFGPLPGDTIRLRYNQAACLERELNSSELPASFSLDQNFPNPFNPSTMIRFTLPKESFVSLKVYDVNGKLAADLISNEFYNAGFYDKPFNASGFSLSSGIYFYVLKTSEFTETKRMVLIK